MKKFILLLCASIVLWLPLTFAATFQAGTDYTVIKPALLAKLNVSPAPKGKVKVVEFFNYGCPACAYAETGVEQWLKEAKPSYVDFQRLPVAFEQGWDTYAKAYYIANALGIEHNITPLLFLAIHGKNDRQYNDLSATPAMINFFVQNGVQQSVAENAFSNASAATLDLQIQQNLQTMQAYGVFATPTFVVGDQYTVDLRQAKSPARMMLIVNYLAGLVRK